MKQTLIVQAYPISRKKIPAASSSVPRHHICLHTHQSLLSMKNYRTEATILALGTLLLGVCIYLGLASFAARDRVVSVRGLAEREVKADQVIWPIVYKTTGDNLQDLYADINRANGHIQAFLANNGIAPSEIGTGAPQIFDRKAETYSSSDAARGDRYNVTMVMTVSSDKVERIRSLMPRMGELLKQGIAISAGDYNSQVQYKFTSLNKIKPQMIEEATKNAREAAIKFANDSDSKLGKIKNASQGLFSIEDRDQYTPYIKRVRVVTSVDYFLNN